VKRAPRRLAAYLARSVLLTTLAVWVVLSGFDVLLAFAGELQDIGKGSYTLSHAVLSTLLTVPRRLYEIFPYVALIGSLLALGGLSARSELTVMRAVGLSKLQIGLCALLPLTVLTAVMVLTIETAGPAGEQRAQALTNSKSKQSIMARYSGLWVREGDVFFNARSGIARSKQGRDWIELNDLRLFQFDDQGRLLSLARARSAEHSRDGWILHEVERTYFRGNSLRVEKRDSEHWRTELDEKALAATVARPRYLTSAELSGNIDYLHRNQLDTAKFEDAYWARWFYPVKVVALCLATLPFAFGSLRAGGFGKRLFVGILIGIGYVLAERMLVNLSDVYRIDVRWAYALSPALLLAVCWGGLAKRV
jgi:lipopolysaccharide export system permease protein